MSKREHYLTWDETFMIMAEVVAQRSKDPNTQVGACIVDPKNRIIGLGYNGLPRGCSDDEFPWCKTEVEPYDNKYYYVVHAEINAIFNSNQMDLDGYTLYVTLHPCHECAKSIIQSGIKQVYYQTVNEITDSIRASRRMFAAAGVKITHTKDLRVAHKSLNETWGLNQAGL